MGDGINAARKAGGDGDAVPGQFGHEFLGDLAAVDRRLTGADHGDREFILG